MQLATPARFERAAIRLEGGCSIQLSYGATLSTFKRRTACGQDQPFPFLHQTLDRWASVRQLLRHGNKDCKVHGITALQDAELP